MAWGYPSASVTILTSRLPIADDELLALDYFRNGGGRRLVGNETSVSKMARPGLDRSRRCLPHLHPRVRGLVQTILPRNSVLLHLHLHLK
jgi:hypothetical protein